MGRKPSVSKQIAEALGTEDKREQLEFIGNLIAVAQNPAIVVTVMLTRGEVALSVNSLRQVTPDEIKKVLQHGVDEVTRRVTLARLEQEQGEPEPPGGLESEPLNDSEVPESMPPE